FRSHGGKVGPVSDPHKEYLGDILTSSRHLLQLINDVLDLARVEAGRIEFHPEAVDLAKLVGEVRDGLRTLAATKRIQVKTQIDPGLTGVTADPAKLKQLLYNYLSNALKFTPEGGQVTLRAGPEAADTYRIEVEDTGIGIRPEDLGRLFVEFQQLDAGAAKKYQGTGLGLALTKRIVEAQGGQVGVRSAPGTGSIFFAVLPRVFWAERESPAGRAALPAQAPAADGPAVVVPGEGLQRDHARPAAPRHEGVGRAHGDPRRSAESKRAGARRDGGGRQGSAGRPSYRRCPGEARPVRGPDGLHQDTVGTMA